MTATDKIRALLDERGVEWFESVTRKGLTWIYRDGKAIRFHPWQPDTLKVSMFDLTPEQAIAATLGSVSEKVSEKVSERTCRAEETECIDTRCYGDPHGCEVYHIHVMECSACGGTYEHVNGSYEFCPRCGRKVVDLQEKS